MRSSRLRHSLSWSVARHARLTDRPDGWMPAAVPGAVQLDWAKAHGLPDYTVGANVQHWDGLEDYFWTYRSPLSALPAVEAGTTLWLVLEGVDYTADVLLDGVLLGQVEGLQTPGAFDVTESARAGSVVDIRVHPAPKSQTTTPDRSQANRSCKPAVSYEWDFHPRLIPLGLWRPVYLEIRPPVALAAAPLLTYDLSPDARSVRAELEVRLTASGKTGGLLRWQCWAPDGAAAAGASVPLPEHAQMVRIPFSLDPVELWWPHDQGQPALYRHTVEVVDAGAVVRDRVEWRTGFRRIRLVMAPDQWKQPTAFPKSRSLPPVTLEINGRRWFAKGTNWVCPDIFPGRLAAPQYAAQLERVRASNLSLVRMWGGAAAPQDDFYDLCDELGILVWQEFPLACNAYPDEPDYLRALDRESRSLIERLRPHACVALWCGGNELFNAWSGMTDQSLPLRLLNRNCFDLDPSRPFLPTAPVDGMGHGHYVMRDPVSGVECWALFQNARCTAYTEFGVPGPASAALLRRILPAEELWPPRAGTSWQTHHAFGAWMKSSHLYLEVIEYYFGASASLEELVEQGQFLQYVGLQGLFEEARRQKPVTSIALNWCFNEPWPAAANNSLVSWPCEPKPALRAVQQACRPTLASARVPRLSWRPDDTFEAELWLLHDGPTDLPAVTVVASLLHEARRVELARWPVGPVAAGANARGPKLEHGLRDWKGGRLLLRLEVIERPEWNSEYTLLRARDERVERGNAAMLQPGATNF